MTGAGTGSKFKSRSSSLSGASMAIVPPSVRYLYKNAVLRMVKAHSEPRIYADERRSAFIRVNPRLKICKATSRAYRKRHHQTHSARRGHVCTEISSQSFL